MSSSFKRIRETALDEWLINTRRTGEGVDECCELTIECEWQDRAIDELGFCHISLFCNLSDWGSNITDILTEKRYDNLDPSDQEDCEVLSRYYIRLLLVVSEFFSDLEILVKETCGFNEMKQAREFLSPAGTTTWLDDLHQFINRICKHKYGNIYRCNHHLPIYLEDWQGAPVAESAIRVGSVDLVNSDSVQYPKLGDLVCECVQTLQRVDNFFQSNPESFARICNKFNDRSCAEETTETAWVQE